MGELGILIDANLLQNGINSTKYRRGIYFVLYNLINEFVKRKDIRLYFYVNKSANNSVKEFIKKEWGLTESVFYEYSPLSFFNLYKKFKNIKVISNILLKIINHQKNKQESYRNSFLSKNHVDVFFSPYSKIPTIFAETSLKKFTVVYDMIPLILKGAYSEKAVDLTKALISSFNRNDFYFTISENTKNDLIKYAPHIDVSHIFTSYISCSDFISLKEKSDAIKKKYNIPLDKKYIFSLFCVQKRKNSARNIKAFQAFLEKNNLKDIVFVVGGSTETSEKDVYDGIDLSNVIFTGYIDDSDLSALYSGAEFFVFTSLYEGFGLPPLEAMKCGCPVIVSNTSSLPEVVGDAGIQIDWDSEEQHILAYEKYYYDKVFREESINKGFIQAQKFSWKRTIDFMIQKMLDNK